LKTPQSKAFSKGGEGSGALTSQKIPEKNFTRRETERKGF